MLLPMTIIGSAGAGFMVLLASLSSSLTLPIPTSSHHKETALDNRSTVARQLVDNCSSTVFPIHNYFVTDEERWRQVANYPDDPNISPTSRSEWAASESFSDVCSNISKWFRYKYLFISNIWWARSGDKVHSYFFFVIMNHMTFIIFVK